MKYTIKWLEKKSPEWIIATLTDEQGHDLTDVSINKTSKKGDVFPNFDNLMSGGEVEGEQWQSAAGKLYLFAPKKPLEAPQFIKDMKRTGSYGVKAAQERKEVMIEKAQERENESIAYFNSLNTAIQFVSAFKNEFDAVNVHDYYDHVLAMRNKFLEEWREYETAEYVDKHKPF